MSPQPGESPDEPLFGYEAWDVDDTGALHHLKYGKWWPRSEPWDDLYIELSCFLHEQRLVGEGEEHAVAAYEHARAAVDLIWNADPHEPFFIWTPEAEEFFREACKHQYLGVCGAGSSGKSFPAAAWALLNYYAAPHCTKVLVTSTSINAAQQRIWGAVIKLFNKMPKALKKLSKLLVSTHLIKFLDPDPDMEDDTTRGIELIAAEPKKDLNAVAKLVGRKQDRLILIGDELEWLSESVNTAFYSNLSRNAWSQYIALSNPGSWLSAFGQFCMPVGGPQSVNTSTYRWLTDRGVVIRFDDMVSQNYLTAKANLAAALAEDPHLSEAAIRKITRRKIQPWRPSYEEIERERRLTGENSLSFMMQYRAMFSTQGASDSIYSNADLIANVIEKVEWDKNHPPVKIVCIDPAFSSGGDRTAMMLLLVGLDATGKRCIQWLETVLLQDDAMCETKTRTTQICEQIRAYVDKHEVQYRHVAYDATGAGAPFGDALVQFLDRSILPVNFGGKATDRPVSASNRKPSHERYANRVSEIWYAGVEVLRGRQFASLPKDLMAEMATRSFTTVAQGRILVQPKSEIKARTGKSPDLADCFHIGLDLCRERLHFASAERGANVLRDDDFFKVMRSRDIVTLSSDGEPDWCPLVS